MTVLKIIKQCELGLKLLPLCKLSNNLWVCFIGTGLQEIHQKTLTRLVCGLFRKENMNMVTLISHNFDFVALKCIPVATKKSHFK